jgi:hypothetical protein
MSAPLNTAHFKRVLPKSKQSVVCMGGEITSLIKKEALGNKYCSFKKNKSNTQNC